MRLLRFSFSLSLSLSLKSKQKRAKCTKILSHLKNSPFRRAVVSLCLFFFIFHFSHTKIKKKAAFWSIQIALTKRFLYLIESHFFFSVACSLAIARESIGRKTHARTVTHTHARTHTHRASSYHGASDALAHPDELLSGFGRGE